MKRSFLLVIIFFVIDLSAQDSNKSALYASKVMSIDSTLTTLYQVISGEKGEARDWDLFKYLFRKNAKLIPTGKNKDGDIIARYISADTYIETSGKWLLENGFHEVEINRVTERFGNIAHAFSSYESYRSKSDEAPFMRGINSIQLLYDNNRWWIVNIYWMQESEEYPIPDQYLPKKS